MRPHAGLDPRLLQRDSPPRKLLGARAVPNEGGSCSAEFMRKLSARTGSRLAPGGMARHEKAVVDALAHHFCIASSQIYRLLRANRNFCRQHIRVTAIRGSDSPTIIIEASAARILAAMVARP